jgi:hypothetical protein
VEAVEAFEAKSNHFLPENAYQQASQFSPQQFRSAYLEFLSNVLRRCSPSLRPS